MLNLSIGLGLGLLVGAWVLAPLFSGQEIPEEKNSGADSLADLYLDKQRAYESLRDVDFDYHTGKLSESQTGSTEGKPPRRSSLPSPTGSEKRS